MKDKIKEEVQKIMDIIKDKEVPDELRFNNIHNLLYFFFYFIFHYFTPLLIFYFFEYLFLHYILLLIFHMQAHL